MTTALYRRFRPENFAEMIGQEHVTEPLSQALRADRVNHAYLFSGPRGCGKTTTARILARCLNCEQGPTPTPCGVCDSCVELARGGPGSLDVVEIDAASHGGVDDARDLRERAIFAPVRDRYKVFIIDEAHMVSPQGFNALLKIVEEPPEHIRFIFATTEPDKVIGTIRSRTHHYPFRLVPPERLQQYLAELCEREGVAIGQGVLPLVVRAGAGSVRDSLSVLDQLIAGAGPDGLEYVTAVALLGYTDAALLDDVVEGLSAGDGAAVFTVVDRVVGSGHDPRRFVEDLLERLRDLLILEAVRDGAHAVFRGVPDDQLTRMQAQASRFGAAELSRAADVANAALTEMTGATSPRLQLELLVARLLLPAADDEERGIRARVDRLEKRVGVAGPATGAAAEAAPAPTPAPRPARPASRVVEEPGPAPVDPRTPVATADDTRPGPAAPAAEAGTPAARAAARPPRPAPPPSSPARPAGPAGGWRAGRGGHPPDVARGAVDALRAQARDLVTGVPARAGAGVRRRPAAARLRLAGPRDVVQPRRPPGVPAPGADLGARPRLQDRGRRRRPPAAAAPGRPAGRPGRRARRDPASAPPPGPARRPARAGEPAAGRTPRRRPGPGRTQPGPRSPLPARPARTAGRTPATRTATSRRTSASPRPATKSRRRTRAGRSRRPAARQQSAPPAPAATAPAPAPTPARPVAAPRGTRRRRTSSTSPATSRARTTTTWRARTWSAPAWSSSCSAAG